MSNVLGGILLLTDRPFRRGDLVETHGPFAKVETTGIRSTRLKRPDETVMIIPNAQLSDRTVFNRGLRARRRIDVSIGLTYAPPCAVLDTLLSELRDLILRPPRNDREDIYVDLKGFGNAAIEIECRCFFGGDSYAEQVAARSALLADIVDLTGSVGGSFALPTGTVHVFQESTEVAESQEYPHPVSLWNYRSVQSHNF